MMDTRGGGSDTCINTCIRGLSVYRRVYSVYIHTLPFTLHGALNVSEVQKKKILRSEVPIWKEALSPFQVDFHAGLPKSR